MHKPVTTDKSEKPMEVVQTVHLIPGHKPGKVNQTPIAKVMFVQIPATPSSHTSILLTEDANNVKLVPYQKPQTLQMVLGLDVFKAVPQTPVMVASIIETPTTFANHALEPLSSTSTKTDVLSDATALQTSTTILVTNANLAKQELLIIHLPEDVKVTQLAKLVNHLILQQEDVKTMLSLKPVPVTLNSALSQTLVSNAHKVKLATTLTSYALSHHRIAITTTNFNWVKINAMPVSHAQEDKFTTETPELATTK
jgi:hypothetical protein